MTPAVTEVTDDRVHHPRTHAAVRTDDYVFSQLIPYLGNKRRLLHVIAAAVRHTRCTGGTFVDLFTGSTVVARWAKRQGFRVIANDWEPYSHEIARGTVALNRMPRFAGLGGAEAVFARLNALKGRSGYVTRHLCPSRDDRPDPTRERMFFTRANGRRIDAIRERLAAWQADGTLSRAERAYVLSALIYAASYASNTSGVFKGYHHGWGGKTATALYRILAPLTLTPPILLDGGRRNLALARDAQQLAGRLPKVCGRRPQIVYVDPPYNQHPYGSNYHVLNTIALWDKPAVSPRVTLDGSVRDKAAIRTDWRTLRRSPYNNAQQALPAFQQLVDAVDARWLLVSYSTDGNLPLDEMLGALARRGGLHVFTQTYKRYRVSTPRMSQQSHTIEFVAAVNLTRRPTNPRTVRAIVNTIHTQQRAALR